MSIQLYIQATYSSRFTAATQTMLYFLRGSILTISFIEDISGRFAKVCIRWRNCHWSWKVMSVINSPSFTIHTHPKMLPQLLKMPSLRQISPQKQLTDTWFKQLQCSVKHTDFQWCSPWTLCFLCICNLIIDEKVSLFKSTSPHTFHYHKLIAHIPRVGSNQWKPGNRKYEKLIETYFCKSYKAKFNRCLWKLFEKTYNVSFLRWKHEV